jgi:hypothetical protein
MYCEEFGSGHVEIHAVFAWKGRKTYRTTKILSQFQLVGYTSKLQTIDLQTRYQNAQSITCILLIHENFGMCLECLQDAIWICLKHHLPTCHKYELITDFFKKPHQHELQLTCIPIAQRASIIHSSLIHHNIKNPINTLSEIHSPFCQHTFLSSIYII